MLPHKEHELTRALVSIEEAVGWLELNGSEVLVEDGVGWLELVVWTVVDDSEVPVLVLASPMLRATEYWLVLSLTDVPTKASVPP
jgi:hypothetical protein